MTGGEGSRTVTRATMTAFVESVATHLFGGGQVESMNLFVRDRGREPTFSSFYESVYPDLVRFVQRRAHPDHAEDVIADAFLVVWRRLDELPKRWWRCPSVVLRHHPQFVVEQ